MGTEMELTLAAAIERAAQSLAAAQPMHQTPDALLSVTQVATILGVGKNYANMLVQSGIIRSLQLNGRKVRRRELEDWMKRMEGMDLTDPAHPVPLDREESA